MRLKAQANYSIFNSSGETVFYDNGRTMYNSYVGGVFQQTTSGLSKTEPTAYELTGGKFATYGFEYKPGFEKA